MGELMGEEGDDKNLHLKGQMMFMAEWNVIMFLSSPSLKNLDALAFTGLYINDLSMHDFSRDLLLASSSQSNELKEALDAELEKTKLMVSIQGVKSPWGDRVVYPRLGTGDTDRWRINKGLYATCHCPRCPISEKRCGPHPK